MKPIYILKGILILCLVATVYVAFDLIEFDTDYEPTRELPECEIWPKFDVDCHYPRYEVLENKR